MTTTTEVIATTFARKLREGDKFIERRERRGRPAFDEEPQEVYVVRRDAEVLNGDTVKVFVEGYRKAFLYDIDYRVRLV